MLRRAAQSNISDGFSLGQRGVVCIAIMLIFTILGSIFGVPNFGKQCLESVRSRASDDPGFRMKVRRKSLGLRPQMLSALHARATFKNVLPSPKHAWKRMGPLEVVKLTC